MAPQVKLVCRVLEEIQGQWVLRELLGKLAQQVHKVSKVILELTGVTGLMEIMVQLGSLEQVCPFKFEC
jgi:hypothetical protein